jgi:hypothetical protein
MELTGERMACPACGAFAFRFPQERREEDMVQRGDLFAHRMSDGSYTVTVGESLHTHVGGIRRLGVFWWMAFRTRPVVGPDGAYWGDYDVPEVLGFQPVLEAAMELFEAGSETPVG